MAAGDLVHRETQPLGGDPALEVGGEEPVVAAGHHPGRTSGQRSSGQGSVNGRSDWASGCPCAAAATSSGTSWKNAAAMFSGSSVRPVRSA